MRGRAGEEEGGEEGGGVGGEVGEPDVEREGGEGDQEDVVGQAHITEITTLQQACVSCVLQ